jgi:hypothetical protein
MKAAKPFTFGVHDGASNRHHEGAELIARAFMKKIALICPHHDYNMLYLVCAQLSVMHIPDGRGKVNWR